MTYGAAHHAGGPGTFSPTSVNAPALDVAALAAELAPFLDVAAFAAELAPLLGVELDRDRLLDDEEAAALLGVPASWVASEARRNRIPHFMLGKYRRYRRDELLAWVDARAHGPRTGAQPVARKAGSQ